MKQIRKITNPIIKSVEKVLNRALDNVYLNTALKVFLILYAALAAPKFPPKLAFLMDNVFVRIGVSFLIVFMAIRDPGIALMIAVAFVITLQTANKLRLMDGSLSQALPGETSWLPSAKEGFFNADTVKKVIDAMDDIVAAKKAADEADEAADEAAADDAAAEEATADGELKDLVATENEYDDLVTLLAQWADMGEEEKAAAVDGILTPIDSADLQ